MTEISEKLILDDRLSAVASFVREGAVFADIGTDHAYLPIHLILERKVEVAFATDINHEPLRRAVENVKKYRLSDKIKCLLCDGFSALKDYGITDGAICGMGGELICAIIEDAPFIKKRGMRLILQPMTRPHEVRKYLLKHGFNITGEKLALTDGKLYNCICADYDGNIRRYSDLELELGKINIDSNRTPLFLKLLERKISAQKKIIDGKMRSNLDVTPDQARLRDYLRLYENRSISILKKGE
ncbi:MAG: SAM-dependent methyltransferase [Clostridiales bacterium]|nr:SAM-dependent methyltransferase [Clostridiales bacterium]